MSEQESRSPDGDGPTKLSSGEPLAAISTPRAGSEPADSHQLAADLVRVTADRDRLRAVLETTLKHLKASIMGSTDRAPYEDIIRLRADIQDAEAALSDTGRQP